MLAERLVWTHRVHKKGGKSTLIFVCLECRVKLVGRDCFGFLLRPADWLSACFVSVISALLPPLLVLLLSSFCCCCFVVVVSNLLT